MKDELNQKFERVMLIDDNIIDLYIASRIIVKNNFGQEVMKYSNAQDALQFLQDNHDKISTLPQIIFVDIYMPLMSGFEFLEAYNHLPPNVKRHCQIFVISSTIDDLDIARANKDENVVRFQVKPINKTFLDRIAFVNT
ncbi:response regulator [Flavobacterium frigidarium]|jgi:CheY-like chemotaxis protein|uniref:response regulator n=1 Tax=Flavobacterium frigidarium TaxID=99286 RepID=UPI00047A5132|nr:response regulator [Flavobacterium frigidarium]